MNFFFGYSLILSVSVRKKRGNFTFILFSGRRLVGEQSRHRDREREWNLPPSQDGG